MNTNRPEVLDKVNEYRAHHGLPPWPLQRLGRHRDGEVEITDIIEIKTDVKSHFVELVFDVIFPDTGDGPRSGRLVMRESVRRPIVVLLRVNGRFVFTFSWRATQGRRATNVSRGWADPNAKTDLDRVRELLERKFGREYVASFASLNPVLLAKNCEDDGFFEGTCDYFLVDTTSSIEAPVRVDKARGIKTYTWAELKDLIRQGKACTDNHSKTALWDYQNSEYYRD